MEGPQPAEIAVVESTAEAGPFIADLLPPNPDKPACPKGPDGQIVVCAQPDDPEQFRLRPLDPRFADQVDEDGHLHVMIGNTEVSADTEAVALPGGVTSKRVMIRAKIKF